jgi:impB/mucB/samB family
LSRNHGSERRTEQAAGPQETNTSSHSHAINRKSSFIVVPAMVETTCAIAASYPAKAFGIKTGTLVREARRMCPEVRLVQAHHKLYVEYRVYPRCSLRVSHARAMRSGKAQPDTTACAS